MTGEPPIVTFPPQTTQPTGTPGTPAPTNSSTGPFCLALENLDYRRFYATVGPPLVVGECYAVGTESALWEISEVANNQGTFCLKNVGMNKFLKADKDQLGIGVADANKAENCGDDGTYFKNDTDGCLENTLEGYKLALHGNMLAFMGSGSGFPGGSGSTGGWPGGGSGWTGGGSSGSAGSGPTDGSGSGGWTGESGNGGYGSGSSPGSGGGFPGEESDSSFGPPPDSKLFDSKVEPFFPQKRSFGSQFMPTSKCMKVWKQAPAPNPSPSQPKQIITQSPAPNPATAPPGQSCLQVGSKLFQHYYFVVGPGGPTVSDCHVGKTEAMWLLSTLANGKTCILNLFHQMYLKSDPVQTLYGYQFASINGSNTCENETFAQWTQDQQTGCWQNAGNNWWFAAGMMEKDKKQCVSLYAVVPPPNPHMPAATPPPMTLPPIPTGPAAPAGEYCLALEKLTYENFNFVLAYGMGPSVGACFTSGTPGALWEVVSVAGDQEKFCLKNSFSKQFVIVDEDPFANFPGVSMKSQYRTLNLTSADSCSTETRMQFQNTSGGCIKNVNTSFFFDGGSVSNGTDGTYCMKVWKMIPTPNPAPLPIAAPDIQPTTSVTLAPGSTVKCLQLESLFFDNLFVAVDSSNNVVTGPCNAATTSSQWIIETSGDNKCFKTASGDKYLMASTTQQIQGLKMLTVGAGAGSCGADTNIQWTNTSQNLLKLTTSGLYLTVPSNYLAIQPVADSQSAVFAVDPQPQPGVSQGYTNVLSGKFAPKYQCLSAVGLYLGIKNSTQSPTGFFFTKSSTCARNGVFVVTGDQKKGMCWRHLDLNLFFSFADDFPIPTLTPTCTTMWRFEETTTSGNLTGSKVASSVSYSTFTMYLGTAQNPYVLGSTIQNDAPPIFSLIDAPTAVIGKDHQLEDKSTKQTTTSGTYCVVDQTEKQRLIMQSAEISQNPIALGTRTGSSQCRAAARGAIQLSQANATGYFCVIDANGLQLSALASDPADWNAWSAGVHTNGCNSISELFYWSGDYCLRSAATGRYLGYNGAWKMMPTCYPISLETLLSMAPTSPPEPLPEGVQILCLKVNATFIDGPATSNIYATVMPSQQGSGYDVGFQTTCKGSAVFRVSSVGDQQCWQNMVQSQYLGTQQVSNSNTTDWPWTSKPAGNMVCLTGARWRLDSKGCLSTEAVTQPFNIKTTVYLDWQKAKSIPPTPDRFTISPHCTTNFVTETVVSPYPEPYPQVQDIVDGKYCVGVGGPPGPRQFVGLLANTNGSGFSLFKNTMCERNTIWRLTGTRTGRQCWKHVETGRYLSLDQGRFPKFTRTCEETFTWKNVMEANIYNYGNENPEYQGSQISGYMITALPAEMAGGNSSATYLQVAFWPYVLYATPMMAMSVFPWQMTLAPAAPNRIAYPQSSKKTGTFCLWDNSGERYLQIVYPPPGNGLATTTGAVKCVESTQIEVEDAGDNFVCIRSPSSSVRLASYPDDVTSPVAVTTSCSGRALFYHDGDSCLRSVSTDRALGFTGGRWQFSKDCFPLNLTLYQPPPTNQPTVPPARGVSAKCLKAPNGGYVAMYEVDGRFVLGSRSTCDESSIFQVQAIGDTACWQNIMMDQYLYAEPVTDNDLTEQWTNRPVGFTNCSSQWKLTAQGCFSTAAVTSTSANFISTLYLVWDGKKFSLAPFCNSLLWNGTFSAVDAAPPLPLPLPRIGAGAPVDGKFCIGATLEAGGMDGPSPFSEYIGVNRNGSTINWIKSTVCVGDSVFHVTGTQSQQCWQHVNTGLYLTFARTLGTLRMTQTCELSWVWSTAGVSTSVKYKGWTWYLMMPPGNNALMVAPNTMGSTMPQKWFLIPAPSAISPLFEPWPGTVSTTTGAYCIMDNVTSRYITVRRPVPHDGTDAVWGVVNCQQPEDRVEFMPTGPDNKRFCLVRALSNKYIAAGTTPGSLIVADTCDGRGLFVWEGTSVKSLFNGRHLGFEGQWRLLPTPRQIVLSPIPTGTEAPPPIATLGPYSTAKCLKVKDDPFHPPAKPTFFTLYTNQLDQKTYSGYSETCNADAVFGVNTTGDVSCWMNMIESRYLYAAQTNFGDSTQQWTTRAGGSVFCNSLWRMSQDGCFWTVAVTNDIGWKQIQYLRWSGEGFQMSPSCTTHFEVSDATVDDSVRVPWQPAPGIVPNNWPQFDNLCMAFSDVFYALVPDGINWKWIKTGTCGQYGVFRFYGNLNRQCIRHVASGKFLAKDGMKVSLTSTCTSEWDRSWHNAETLNAGHTCLQSKQGGYLTAGAGGPDLLMVMESQGMQCASVVFDFFPPGPTPPMWKPSTTQARPAEGKYCVKRSDGMYLTATNHTTAGTLTSTPSTCEAWQITHSATGGICLSVDVVDPGRPKYQLFLLATGPGGVALANTGRCPGAFGTFFFDGTLQSAATGGFLSGSSTLVLGNTSDNTFAFEAAPSGSTVVETTVAPTLNPSVDASCIKVFNPYEDDYLTTFNYLGGGRVGVQQTCSGLAAFSTITTTVGQKQCFTGLLSGLSLGAQKLAHGDSSYFWTHKPVGESPCNNTWSLETPSIGIPAGSSAYCIKTDVPALIISGNDTLYLHWDGAHFELRPFCVVAFQIISIKNTPPPATPLPAGETFPPTISPPPMPTMPPVVTPLPSGETYPPTTLAPATSPLPSGQTFAPQQITTVAPCQCGHGTCVGGVCLCDSSLSLGYWRVSSTGKCDECDFSHFGANCSQTCPGTSFGTSTATNVFASCSGNGVCSAGVSGTGKCQCFGLFRGSDCSLKCSQSVDGWVCGGDGYGTCNSAGSCVCNTGYVLGPTASLCTLPAGQTPAPTTAPAKEVLTVTVKQDFTSFTQAKQDELQAGIARVAGVSSSQVVIVSTAAGASGTTTVNFMIVPASQVSAGKSADATNAAATKMFLNSFSDPGTSKSVEEQLNIQGAPTLASEPTPAPEKKSTTLIAAVAGAVGGALLIGVVAYLLHARSVSASRVATVSEAGSSGGALMELDERGSAINAV